MGDDSFETEIWIIVCILVFLLAAMIAFLILQRFRRKNKSKKLEEEIHKLQQYVNSCDRKLDCRGDNINTQPQLQNQSSSFTKTHPIDQQDQEGQTKKNGKIYYDDMDKLEREIINQQQSYSPNNNEKVNQGNQNGYKLSVGIKKKNLQIQIPQD
ncbi:unnamed protein product [Paramecium primaurelia]|uniref:Transmembrane protein n=2 Tax=Paramecium TaxID=5884 RepID=A0A8S1SDK6_9CILI|nr:unnamed protein product [Paramecium primaurelia]CAD8138056.1 unnamed protein product [Paramecium pentaurelia]